MFTTEEKNASMQKMNDDQFYGKISNDEDYVKQCAVMSIIRNQKVMLDDDLTEAKIKFAEAALIEDNWLEKNKREMKCKVIEGQICMLNKIERELENMISVMQAA